MIGFLYVINFISLWIGAIALMFLLFTIINKAIPITTTGYDYYSDSSSTAVINSSISCLIVCTPIFLFLFIYLKRQIFKYPEFRSYKIRKVLIILILLVCFCTAIGYLISLINSFLRGNITINFILEVFVISILLGIIFAYYFQELSDDKKYIN